MPERNGVLNIADEYPRPRNSEGQAVPQPKYYLQHPRSFADRETGPRSAEARRGPYHLRAGSLSGEAAHKVTRVNLFSGPEPSAFSFTRILRSWGMRRIRRAGSGRGF